MCPGEDLNLHAHNRRYHLKVVRLPISPPGQVSTTYLYHNFFCLRRNRLGYRRSRLGNFRRRDSLVTLHV